MKLWDLMDMKLFREMVVQKYVRINEKDGLKILGYTEKAQFDQYWNEVTTQCRGLVIDRSFNVLARPFTKFQNYDPNSDNRFMDFPVDVTDKMDGSLGILFFEDGDPHHSPDHMSASSFRNAMAYGGTWHYATRGSFDSEQAIEMRAIMEEKYAETHSGYKRVPLDTNWTYLFEIIYPGNRIVLDYGDTRDLFLLGAINNHTGYYKPAEHIRDWKGPKAKTFSYKTLQEALEAAPRKNAEGYVIYFPDLDYRIKLKQDDYVALHKIVTGLTERRIWELMKEGKTLEDMCAIVPDEWHAWLQKTYGNILMEWNLLLGSVHDDYEDLMYDLLEEYGSSWTRKQMAERALKLPHPGLMFSLQDRKDIEQKVWDMVRPTAE